MPPRAPDLRTLERWLRAVITHPGGARAGVRSADAQRALRLRPEETHGVVLPSPTLEPLERLGIYSRMYTLRLEACVESDYPVLLHAMGREPFDAIVRRYVRLHPSRNPNLNRYGSRLPGLLARQRTLPRRRFLVDLARLERAVAEVFDETRAEAADPSALRNLPPERWARVTFAAIPALRLLEFSYPANAYFRAVKEDRHPAIPRPRRSWVAIYRKDDVVWRRDLDLPMFEVLRALLRGRPLASALDGCLRRTRIAPEALRRQSTAWFGEWVQEGLFARIVAPRR